MQAAEASEGTGVCHTPDAVGPRLGRHPMLRPVVLGLIAVGAMAVSYGAIVLAASGSLDHLGDQIRADWYLLVPIVVGFGVQVGLISELRRRHALHRAGIAAGTAGSGTSVVGMLACCAHHVADLAPFLGLTAAAPFLYRNRVAFMLTGLAANAIGAALAGVRLRRLRAPAHTEEVEHACASV